MSARRSPHMNVMIEAAEKAGRALIRDFGEIEQLQVSRKGPGDFVSAADHKAEKILKEELLKARPSFGFLLEEGGEIKGEDKSYRWIIDPLDGTTNFLHGMPHWSIAIALEKDKEIVAAVIHDPIKNEIFSAEKGGGAFSNSKRLRVAGRKSLVDALVTIGGDCFGDQYSLPEGCSVRCMGSACLDLAYVAAGRFDAFCEPRLMPWDIAAGSLLVKEAGGYISEMDGGKNVVYGKGVVAANPALHTELIKNINKSDKKETVVKMAT
ncbi:MAG: inositol monophosphatase [Proteobacteria bacterium]|nr:inositol monophosphatase [Pseudomonadota bacterium]